MRIRRKPLLVLTVSALLLTVLVGAVWEIADWPPPRYLLRYGLTPGCEATGRAITVEGVTFVEIGPGCFRMGSTCRAKGDLLGRICDRLGLPWGEKPEPTNEMPVHFVEFRRGFWIARTEVTNEQFEQFAQERERREYSPGGEHPVVNVSWQEATKYCAWLAERSGLPVRLPSEAEWEAACRSGSRGEYCFGNESGDLAGHAWFDVNARGGAHEVGTRRANAWGLCDLHGNVWEWCEDTYHASYEGAPADGSAWTEDGEEWQESAPGRVGRGGGWGFPAEYCRSAIRRSFHPGRRLRRLGFRPAFISPDEDEKNEDDRPETEDREE